MDCLFTPIEIGLPEKFLNWRPMQWDGIVQIMDDLQSHRFAVMCAPVGTGKSASYVAIALLLGYRVIVCTASKGLQDQLVNDFGGIGLIDMRGRANYDCIMAANFTCEDGSHAKCVYNNQRSVSSKCAYRANLEEARLAKLVVTNYSYWMNINKYTEDALGPFDLLILDEAHEAPQEVTGMMSITLSGREVYRMLNGQWPQDANDASIDTWRNWARHHLPRALDESERIKEVIKLRGGVPSQEIIRESQRWQSLVRKLTTLSTASGPWASEPKKNADDSSGYLLEPLWASEYAEQILFCGIGKILFVSATINRQTLKMCGVLDDAYVFREYPYIFPINRSPILWVPTVDVNWDMSAEDYDLLLNAINQFIGRRMDRKGLIHTVSYKLRDTIYDNSIYQGHMITHERSSQSLEKHLTRFKKSQPPSVFISPSIGTGHDFSYQLAEYQLIPKLPFPIVKGSRIMEARCIKKKGGDPKYRDYLMIMSLQQMVGRIMRAPDDQGETVILDNNMRWVWSRHQYDFAAWFRRLYRRQIKMPEPPAPLRARAA